MPKKVQVVDRSAEEMALAIAAHLFTNGQARRAVRLELKDAHERSLGRWCFAAAVEEIERTIKIRGIGKA